MNDTIASMVKDLIATPNGRIFLVGSIMCIGPAYFTFTNSLEPTAFDYAMLGVGALFVIISAVMATYRAMFEARKNKE